MPICESEYVTAHLAARERNRKGEHQLYCQTCKRWRWIEECEHPKLTAHQFRLLAWIEEEGK